MKVFGFVGTDHLRTKTIINETLEQVSQFTYLGCSISYHFSNVVEFKLATFLQLIGTVKRTVIKKLRKGSILKIHNTLSFTYIFIWVRKLDSNSLTKTKNWSGRNEVTETSGRLHPLWPQNKWLHTPRATDYRILDRIDEYRRNWLSHLQRMPQNRIPLKSYRYRQQGSRTIGRPKKRWREQL